MKFTKWLCAADSHGDQIDPLAERAFFEFNDYWKPDHKIHMGDAFDFRWLRKNASEQETRERTTADLEMGKDFLAKFQPDVYLLGNHENRLWNAAMSDDGKLADLASRFIVEIKEKIPNTVILPYDKREGIHQWGDRRFLHGFSAGIYAVRNTTMVYGKMAMAHVHAFDSFTVADLDHTDGHSSGCLMKVSQKYNASHMNTLKQNNGWLYGLKFEDGTTHVWRAERVKGTFILPSEFKEIRYAERNDGGAGCVSGSTGAEIESGGGDGAGIGGATGHESPDRALSPARDDPGGEGQARRS